MAQTEAIPTAMPGVLAGIRILDFTWVRAGPWCTRWLGALGAEVIKVAWPENPNTRRLAGRTTHIPVGLPVNLNTLGNFSDTNANKLSVTINTRTARGILLIKRLVAISDIVIENFAYGVLDRWGLGYQEMTELRSDIIYVSMSGFGHTGRNRDYQIMGHSAQALSGLTYLSGLPDKPPAGWGWSYMDDTAGMYGAMYALTALYHRNVTGQGQLVDMSQWITGVPLNGPVFLDMQVNGRADTRAGYPSGNRAHWPGTPLVNNYRGHTVAPHNAYRTSTGRYNDWCTIACFSDEEWQKLVGVMGLPTWATDPKFATLEGRLEHQQELDQGIEAWTKTLGKYEIMERCQAAGVRSMPVQGSQDLVDNDPQLRYREMYREMEHPVMGVRAVQNAPFKMPERPVVNSRPGPLIGQHNKDVFEGLLGISHEELVSGFKDGAFWPRGLSMDDYPYLKEMIDDALPVRWAGNRPGPNPPPAPTRHPNPEPSGAFAGLRVLELSDEKGQWCGKLVADIGADVIKIEPPGGEAARTVGPFYQDAPHPDRSLSFWHYNTSKRGITLNLETDYGRQLFRRLAEKADVVLETFRPGYMASLGLGYEELRKDNPALIMCSLTPFGQSGPWKSYQSSDLLHLASSGQMAGCGYSEEEVPDAPPIAPGGGQAWHIGGQYAYIAIAAALVYRTATGLGQNIDVSIHDSCALTTENIVTQYIYRKEVVRRQTGRHASFTPSDLAQHMCADGKYVNVAAQIVSELTPKQIEVLGAWIDELGIARDLLDEKIRNPDAITDNELFLYLIGHLTRNQVYHGGQKRGFNIGAVWSPGEVMEDLHVEERRFWTEVQYPELEKKFRHPGHGGIFSRSPWKISRRAPLIGEHNGEVLCGELGLSRAELAVLAEGSVI